MNWQELVVALARQVSRGQVTIYAEVSEWAYGKRNLNQPVRSLLRGAVNHGFGVLTNRVVGADGALADLPEGRDQQRQQLEIEGIAFTIDGRVDLASSTAVVLKRE
jgi:alkylated DNA nucleotide flippase Atl1